MRQIRSENEEREGAPVSINRSSDEANLKRRERREGDFKYYCYFSIDL